MARLGQMDGPNLIPRGSKSEINNITLSQVKEFRRDQEIRSDLTGVEASDPGLLIIKHV